jgi:hypothetical protein
MTNPETKRWGGEKCLQAGAAASTCKRTFLSQQIDAEKRTGFGAGRGQGEILNFEKFGCNQLTNVFQHPLANALPIYYDSVMINLCVSTSSVCFPKSSNPILKLASSSAPFKPA